MIGGLLAQPGVLPRRGAPFCNRPRRVRHGEVAQLAGAHAQGKQLVDVVERGLPLHLAPALALDDVARSHRPAIVSQRHRPAAASDLAVGVMMAADCVRRR